jgi:2-polyprenyl-3-methyl-5-hydroxy-6-metoxy-1,4-benzoquinol methylase
MRLLARDQLRSAAYWDRRAARPDVSAVMWPNLAFNACVDRRQKQAMLELLPDVTGTTVLEVGCGTGRISFFLADHGAVVTGTDFSEQMIARANQSLGERPGARVRFIKVSRGSPDARRLTAS